MLAVSYRINFDIRRKYSPDLSFPQVVIPANVGMTSSLVVTNPIVSVRIGQICAGRVGRIAVVDDRMTMRLLDRIRRAVLVDVDAVRIRLGTRAMMRRAAEEVPGDHGI